MYETVLWATDGSDGAESALAEALRLVGLSGGHLVAVHCDQRLNGEWGRVANKADPRVRIARTVDELRDRGCDVELVMRKSHREAADVAAEIAAEFDADVIVCGTRGRGALSGAFLGSFTQRLLHVAPCPVLAVGPRADASALGRRPAAEARAWRVCDRPQPSRRTMSGSRWQ